MNNKGQAFLVWLLVAFVFIMVLFSTIDPLKESLDTIRGGAGLNCQGTPTFNQTAFDNDEGNSLNELTRRPTCFATGLTVVWFVIAFLIAVVAWVAKNSTKTRRRIKT